MAMQHAFAPIFKASTFVLDCVDAQRGRLFLWSPVCFGVGISLFFIAKNEPSVQALWAAALTALALWGLSTRISPYVAPFFIASAICASGYAIAGLRAHTVSAPVLSFRYYGPIEGRVVKIDRSASDAVRLTLDSVYLKNTPPTRTPKHVRISLHAADIAGLPPYFASPGQHIMLTGHLSKPPGPSEPGGFDFQRMAWFDQLGAVGYTRSPVLIVAPAAQGTSLFIHRLRQKLSTGLQTQIPDQAGAFAAAILTGDRAAISQDTAESLRSSNLSHLLAISGLHMGLLTAVIFGGLRSVLAAIPYTFYHWPNKKIAAGAALIAGAFYLALSGGNVATERAYIMVSIMFVAVLLDRTAISLRSVALAAMLILILRPEVLVEPGFQMSFAATTALVCVFAWVRSSQIMYGWPRWQSNIATLVLSSAVAGLATAPVAAAHFNRIADFGLIANLAAVPLMGAVVMPSAVAAVALAPFGLEGLAFKIMEPAIKWILWVAQTVSNFEGAVTRVPAPPNAVLALIAIGGLFVCIWRGRARVFGGLPMLLGFVLWMLADRPSLLISADGGLSGRMTHEGRALSKEKGAGFAAMTWLENDGDLPVQSNAAQRNMPPLDVGGVTIAHVVGRGWKDRAITACAAHEIVIVNQNWEKPADLKCRLYDLSYLQKSGSLAFEPLHAHKTTGARLITAYGVSGIRMWNSRELRTSTPQSIKAIRDGMARDTFGASVWVSPK